MAVGGVVRRRPGGRGLAGVQPPLELAEHEPNRRWRQKAWAKARRLPVGRAAASRAGWKRSVRPASGQSGEVLGERRGGAAQRRRDRQRRRDVGVDGAEQGAVLGSAGAGRCGTSRRRGSDGRAEQLDVVVAARRTPACPAAAGAAQTTAATRAAEGSVERAGADRCRCSRGANCNGRAPERVRQSAMDHEALHRRAREKGVNRLVLLARPRLILTPFFLTSTSA